MVLFAFSLQDQVEKYGAYVAIGCFFGLAVLSLLYFAQARELRRLRDWAGRSPEFSWDELERRVLSLESRRASPQRVAAPAPAPAMATNGANKLKPEQVAALAFARAAGVAEPPHPPKPAAAPPAAPVPQPAAVAVQDPPQTAVEAAPSPPPAAGEGGPVSAPVTGNGNGTGHGDVPAPLTPAGRRVPAQPLRRPAPTPAPARRMPSGPPARRETSTRSVVLITLLGLVVAGGVAFGAIKLLGGSDGNTPPPNNHVVDPGTGEQTSSGGNGGGSGSKSKAPATPPRAERTVVVLNGTVADGLAGDMKTQLVDAGYTDANVDAGNDPQGKGVTTSTVFYKRGAGTQARDVARVLGISSGQVKPIDATLQASAQDHTVVVEIGADKAGN
jgi:hypothetical protein